MAANWRGCDVAFGPEQTIAAVLDHGNIVAGTIEQGIEEAREVMERLDRLDIRFADVAARLERVGVQQFAEAFDKSINAIKKNARLRCLTVSRNDAVVLQELLTGECTAS